MTVRPISRHPLHRPLEAPGWWCPDCRARVDGPWHECGRDDEDDRG